MKKSALLFCFGAVLASSLRIAAQPLVCQSQVYVSLDKDCTATLMPEQMLEGQFFNNCVVEVDKIPPSGDGPWAPAVLNGSDVGKTYMFRVRQVISGQICWGDVTIEDKLPPILQCKGITTVTLNNGAPLSFPASQLNATGTDACSGSIPVAFAGGAASKQFTCSDVGVQSITLQASDTHGNTATCKHTVMVTSLGACMACVDSCPTSQIVSFEEGHFDLLPEFQAQNWSAFEPFGTGFFDHTNCALQDSAVDVQYQQGTTGYNWFTRSWFWFTPTGQFAVCQQNIVFPVVKTINMQGKVYIEDLVPCSYDGTEQGVSIFPIKVTYYPSGTAKTYAIEPDGTYQFDLEMSAQDSLAELSLVLPPGVTSSCPTALSLPLTTSSTAYTFDIGLLTEGECPSMQVEMGAGSGRRCLSNLFTLQCCNIGLDTAFNAYTTLRLDSLLSLSSASVPYTLEPDGTYTLQVGNVAPFTCVFVNCLILVDCDAELGQTLCAEATAYPSAPCEGAWTGPVVTATAKCEGDSVRFILQNTGQQDMTAPLEFIVIEDFIMYKDGTFQLNAGGTAPVSSPANGSTWRLEANQTPGFPVNGIVVAAIEGCGGLNTPGLINAFTQGDNARYTDVECVEVRGSFDPNDKSAVPAGYDTEHYIRANEEIEYRIRFQNTGNDTAFRVVIVDTLSALLDPYTLEAGASSHPYRLNVFPGGILHFVFDPIALPDSNVNEVASHGFVQFRIAQQPDLPDGTVFENTAAIYFDHNPPVITNSTWHTVGIPFILVDSPEPPKAGLRVTLSPNPFRDQAVLSVQGGVLRQGLLSLYDTQGRLLCTQSMVDNQTVLDRSEIPAGLYFFTLTENGVRVAEGKIQAH